MSADSYGECPRCLLRRKREYEEEQRWLETQYGKADAISWAQAMATFKASAEPEWGDEKHRTLREYHELYVDEDGVLHARYSGSCDKCDFAVEWKGSPVKVDPREAECQ